MTEERDRSGIQLVERVTSIIEVAAEFSDTGVRLSEVARRTDLGRATAHRLLRGMVHTGLLDYDEQVSRYFPGVKLVAFSAAGSNRFGLVQTTSEVRRRLAEQTGDTVFLALRMKNEAVCIARDEGTFPIKILTLNIGDRRPLGIGAASLAILSFTSEEERAAIIQENTPEYEEYGIDVRSVEEMVQASRELGFALDPGRILAGTTAVGLPICAPDGTPKAALAVAAINERMNEERRRDIVALLRNEIGALEEGLAPLLAGGRQHLLDAQSRSAPGSVRAQDGASQAHMDAPNE